jgi:hypothetical protein
MEADPLALRFLGLAYAFSWSVGALLYATGGLQPPLHLLVGGFAFMLGPAAAALILTRGVRWTDRQRTLGLRLPLDRWLFVAWALPAALVGGALVLSAAFPGVTVESPAAGLARTLEAARPGGSAQLAHVPGGLLSAGLVGQAFVLGPLLNFPFMLSEELGWRGLLWERWSKLGFARQALATGVVWGLWHAPLILMGFNYPDAPILGVALMVVFCVLLAVPLHLVRVRGGTVWHACLFHGTVNAAATLGRVCVRAPSWVGNGILGVPGFLLLGLVAAVVLLGERRFPARRPPGAVLDEAQCEA